MSINSSHFAAAGAAGAPEDENDKNIQQWKIKKLIKSLESARGNGTSMISLIIRPGDQIAQVSKMLAEEYGTASNIKSRVNRQSVLGAITSTQQRLKLYNKVPPNGLVVYCGTINTAEGKEKKVNIDFEPFKPINTSLYLCVAGDAVVANSSGVGRRLRDVVATKLADHVYGSTLGRYEHESSSVRPGQHSVPSNTLSVARATAFQSKGIRSCVSLTLRDGRKLTCTPDHRLLVVRDGAPVWIEAGCIRTTDLAVCGPDTPVDELNADPSELGWMLPAVGTMSHAADRARLLAFARLCGLLLTDGCLYWNATHSRCEAALNVGHELDVASVQADILLVCGSTCGVHLTVSKSAIASSVFKIATPLALAKLFHAAGLQCGDRRKQPAAWPAWVLDERTPLCIVREFMGGVMGGDGYAPCLNAGSLDHQKIYSQHCAPEFSAAMATKMQQFCQLLSRLGVAGAVATVQTVVWNGRTSHKHVVRLPSTQGSLAFDEKIGFRHCVHKQARNSAASVYRRIYDLHVNQRQKFVELVKAERESGAGRNAAIQQAQAKMRMQVGPLLDETAIKMSYAGLQKIEAGAVVARAHPDLPSFENVMSDIGALPMFSGHQGKSCSVPRGQEFPALLLSVCDVSPAGEHEVFDISVDSLHSFTANGVVVHNCDNKFHTEPLNELLESDEKFGFIIMDGSGTLFGTLAGNAREVLHRFTVDLPKKHGRGGQSALRFARLRLEKRHNYVRKVAELAVQFFITNDRPNVTGLVLAGLADFKTELSASDMFDPRLQAIIMKVVDVSYGGDNGFNQAIELAAEVLANVKFIREKKLISQFFDEIAQDSGKYCFGVDDTLKALELGAVETLLVWENLESQRFVVKNSAGEEKVLHLTKEQLADSSHFREAGTNAELEVQEQMALLEWFANNYKRFGAKLEIVTNRSQEGSQFCKGFGGIGGLLRYKVDFADFEEHAAEDDDSNAEDDFI